ncbi:MAG TPA: DUF1289 domain-containing protein [Verrucomicrobiae bacterium]|nr:DUF1289 domain-containing protein [Verrucomicrobiae bacterium]
MISPCINVCKLDSHGVCMGCHRTGNEIARWTQMTEDERWRIISMLAGRRSQVIARSCSAALRFHVMADTVSIETGAHYVFSFFPASRWPNRISK